MLYPNPATEYCIIKTETGVIDGTIFIYAMSGELLKTEFIGAESEVKLDLSLLVSGNYIIKVESNKKIYFFHLKKT